MQAVETTKKDLHLSLHSPSPRHNRCFTSFQIYFFIRENTRDCQPLLLSLLSLNRLSRFLRLSRLLRLLRLPRLSRLLRLSILPRLLRLPRLSALEAGGEKVEEAAAALPISPNQFLFPAKFKEFPQLQRSPWPFVKDLGGKIQEGSSGFEEIELILFDCKKQPL